MTGPPAPVQLGPGDEGPHPPGDQRLWQESWYLDFTNRDGTLGGYVRLSLFPNLRSAWYWACVTGEGRRLVTVLDHDVPLPRARSLAVRTEGLWADHTVETPYQHMSLACEAFAVALDDPVEVYRDPRGDRVPLGLDLEWETVGAVYPWTGASRYEMSCDVHGEVLLGDETIRFDGVGHREHSWGEADWWSSPWVWTAGALEDGTRFHAARIRAPGREASPPGYVQPPGGAPQRVERCEAQEHLGEHGLPTGARIVCGALVLAVQPVAFSPVHLLDDTGGERRESRLPRALCRFEAADGRRGAGWTEWNQPA